jgi:putative flippase GtrA
MLVKYGVVGGAGAVFSLVVYTWLVASFQDEIGYVWPSVIVGLVWFPVAFLLHLRFVFAPPARILRAFGKFLSVQWSFFFLSPLTLIVLVEIMGLRPLSAYAVSMVLISALSFLFSRLLIFRTSASDAASRGAPNSPQRDT